MPNFCWPISTQCCQLAKKEIHLVPSYKERSYKEQLVEMLQSKEQRLVEI